MVYIFCYNNTLLSVCAATPACFTKLEASHPPTIPLRWKIKCTLCHGFLKADVENKSPYQEIINDTVQCKLLVLHEPPVGIEFTIWIHCTCNLINTNQMAVQCRAHKESYKVMCYKVHLPLNTCSSDWWLFTWLELTGTEGFCLHTAYTICCLAWFTKL